MIDTTLLLIFIPTFFLVSITPGMCMTLAMTLGMSIGVRRTIWMMYGELLGVAAVALASVLGASAVMLKYPEVFNILKLLGAAYIIWLGINMWFSKGKLALTNHIEDSTILSNRSLFYQGLITAVANPKGWAFMLSLLPPFINPDNAFAPQISILLLVILFSEFICMMLYAAGGKTIGKALTKQGNVKLLNKIAGTLMIGVAFWLAST
ncbi:MAG: LysE family translocator [Gammaproteobacteria bacterium]|nr:LysE family translocator [Gammaproteobacteria bacterium]